MNFIYDKKLISTLDEIKMSVADLRDLINAGRLSDERQLIEEYNLIIKCILYKNNLKDKSIYIL